MSGDVSIERPPGTVIAGKYRLGERLGAGAMGVVYCAEHLATGGRVAVKVLTAGGHAEATRRFQAEARNCAALGHPNTVRVVDFGADGDCLFLVMEHLEGRPLSAVLASGGPLPWRRAARIAVQVLRSLREAHERHIVHRDIKPSNIVLLEREPDFVKVVDFGISRSLEGSGAGTVGAVGTPAYMAPELWRSDPVDGRTDLYAVGCVLYEMLAGRPPFVAGSHASYAHMHLSAEPVLGPGAIPPDVPAALAEVLRRLLRKEPRQRFASAREVLVAMEGLGESQGAAEPSIDTLTSNDRPAPSRRKTLVVAGLAAATAVAAVIAAVVSWPWPWHSVEKAALDATDPVNHPGTCVLAAADDPDAADQQAESRAREVQALLRGRGLPAGCRGLYARKALRNAYAVMSGMIQHDGTIGAQEIAAVLEILEPRFPDMATRKAPRDQMRAPIEVLLPDEPHPGPVAAHPTGEPVTVCVLGPSDDLTMAGAWRDLTPRTVDHLRRRGFTVDCELPYLRRVPRLQGASSRGLIQHDGRDPEALDRVTAAMQAVYPGIGVQLVETRRLFRQFDILVPDS